jgi:hypothetical protein
MGNQIVDIKVIKELKNGNKIIEVSRQVTTQFKLSIQDSDDGKDLFSQELKTIDYLDTCRDLSWNAIKKIMDFQI